MKCRFIVDIDADPSMVPEDQKAKIRWRPARSRKGKERLDPYFAAGTEYEHPMAAHFVEIGCAVPADQECTTACGNISQAELDRRAQDYRADAAGIHDPKDRDLFFAGVITGYEDLGNGKHAYIPGPNYDAWDEARKQAAQAKDTSI